MYGGELHDFVETLTESIELLETRVGELKLKVIVESIQTTRTVDNSPDLSNLLVRIVLRPHDESSAIRSDEKLRSRLSDLSISFPIDATRDLKSQILEISRTIEEDVTMAMNRPDEPSFFILDAIRFEQWGYAAFIGLLVGFFCGLGVEYLVRPFGSDKVFEEALSSIAAAIIAVVSLWLCMLFIRRKRWNSRD